MKRRLADSIALCALFACMGAGCATAPATDFHGRWRPVNHFADAPQAISLAPAYVFEASPMDGTLKSMLSRWAKDSNMTVSYLPSVDYTLYGPVVDIHTVDLQQALQLVNSAYAAQNIVADVSGRQIVARMVSPQSPPAGEAGE